MKAEPKLNKSTFWDTDYNSIDWEKHADYVICRVLERGSLNEWFEIKKYYGVDKIISAATNVRYLEKKSMFFISNIFNVPINKFRCYNDQQLSQGLWQF